MYRQLKARQDISDQIAVPATTFTPNLETYQPIRALTDYAHLESLLLAASLATKLWPSASHRITHTGASKSRSSCSTQNGSNGRWIVLHRHVLMVTKVRLKSPLDLEMPFKAHLDA
jgi:hypothetical protein